MTSTDKKVELKGNVKTFYAKSQKEWRKWLEKNHQKEKSLWLIIYRKESKTPSVYYPEAVDEALCFGWIDSKPNKRDTESYFQFFAKRNPKSNWSKVNKEKIARLMAQELVKEAGLKMIELAKQTGTWTALDDIENIAIPKDLQLKFDKSKIAYKNWEAFPRSVKKGILEWILNAKRAETRQKRIEETIAQAKKNIRANQYRQ
jgi:uncharacterized protein YdeI (YjbR/CyaY-like superfamily)